MQHPHEVDMVLAVLNTQEIVVYGSDLLRHRVADGEEGQASVARIPIGRPESAEALKVYFAECGNVTWAKVLDAGRQILGMERAMASDPRLTQEYAINGVSLRETSLPRIGNLKALLHRPLGNAPSAPLPAATPCHRSSRAVRRCPPARPRARWSPAPHGLDRQLRMQGGRG